MNRDRKRENQVNKSAAAKKMEADRKTAFRAIQTSLDKEKESDRKKLKRKSLNDDKKQLIKNKNAEKMRITRYLQTAKENENDAGNKKTSRKESKANKKQSLLADNNASSVEECRLGNFDLKCKNCGAYHFPEEIVKGHPDTFNDCCSHGKLKLQHYLPSYPDQLKVLFTENYKGKSEFLANIRKINNSFALASLSSLKVQFEGGPPCYKIQGQVYH